MSHSVKLIVIAKVIRSHQQYTMLLCVYCAHFFLGNTITHTHTHKRVIAQMPNGVNLLVPSSAVLRFKIGTEKNKNKDNYNSRKFTI